jgi:hypothetical protein
MDVRLQKFLKFILSFSVVEVKLEEKSKITLKDLI